MRLKFWLFGGLLFGASTAANASDYGCKVLLCLANPNGSTAVSQCVPPIDQLHRDLARGRPFPTCDMASAPDGTGGRAWAQQGVSYYDPCPPGTTALPSGSLAVEGAGGALYTGIGEGDGLMPSYGESASPMPSKVCVGKHVGDALVVTGSGESYAEGVAASYDRVALLDAQGSPNVIDVYINSALYRRVRW